MTRYQLTVPQRDNDGAPLVTLHNAVGDTLDLNFEGYTVHEATGHWFGEHEPVTVYTVDSDYDSAHGTLRALALYVKREADQDAVYLTRQHIDTELI